MPEIACLPFDAAALACLQRDRYYRILLLQSGDLEAVCNSGRAKVRAPALLCLSPYQFFEFRKLREPGGLELRFLPDFYCIEMHHNRISCSGILFNSPLAPPELRLNADEAAQFAALFDELRAEAERGGESQAAMLLSYLKIIIIRATRMKSNSAAAWSLRQPDHLIIERFRQLLEESYCLPHSESRFAAQLQMPATGFRRFLQRHFGRTLAQLRRERVMLEARRKLVLSDLRVQDVAQALGFEDPFYFSRAFKKHAGMAPEDFRRRYLNG